jgi:hypothetical protein
VHIHSVPNARTWAEIATDIKEEIKDFTQTRVQLFKTEFGQKLALLKVAVILACMAASGVTQNRPMRVT